MNYIAQQKYVVVIDDIRYAIVLPQHEKAPVVIVLPDGNAYKVDQWEEVPISSTKIALTTNIFPHSSMDLDPIEIAHKLDAVLMEEDGERLNVQSDTPEAADLLDRIQSGDKDALKQFLECSNPHSLFVEDAQAHLKQDVENE